MLISRVLRGVLPAYLLVFSFSIDAQSTSRKGTYEGDCEGYTLHLSAPRKSGPNGELTLRLQWSYLYGPLAWKSIGWYPVKARRCETSSGKCEDATDAKVRFEKFGKRAVGSFTAQFADEHQEGTFNVRFHRKHPKDICL